MLKENRSCMLKAFITEIKLGECYCIETLAFVFTLPENLKHQFRVKDPSHKSTDAQHFYKFQGKRFNQLRGSFWC